MDTNAQFKTLKNVGNGAFPTYLAESIKDGALFAEASLGFLGKVRCMHLQSGSGYAVTANISEPVTATMGMQLAGWTVADCLISGPIRTIVKKPASVFKKLGKVKKAATSCLY